MLSAEESVAQPVVVEQVPPPPQHWWVSLHRAGFYGKYALGGRYLWNDRHEAGLSLGTSTTGNTSYGQLNLDYRYSPWLYPVIENQMWRPLQLGLFALYSMNDGDYFFNSPDGYPTPGYYDRTDLRFGLEFGTSYRFEKSGFEISYRMRLLDLGFVAIYNNAHRDLQYYLSSGLELAYRLNF